MGGRVGDGGWLSFSRRARECWKDNASQLIDKKAMALCNVEYPRLNISTSLV